MADYMNTTHISYVLLTSVYLTIALVSLLITNQPVCASCSSFAFLLSPRHILRSLANVLIAYLQFVKHTQDIS